MDNIGYIIVGIVMLLALGLGICIIVGFDRYCNRLSDLRYEDSLDQRK